MKRQLTAITSIFLVFCMLFTAFPVAAANVDNAENSASVDDNMKIQSTNSVGAMIADAVGEEENRQENNNGVNVLSVEMDGKTATAEIEDYAQRYAYRRYLFRGRHGNVRFGHDRYYAR